MSDGLVARWLGPVAWVVLVMATLAPSARAIPPFARRYEVPCGTCHLGHYPKLNEFGRAFREAGFRMPPGAEEAARVRGEVEVGEASARVDVLREVPLSVRLVSRASVEAGPAVEPALIGFLTGGGPVANGVSTFFSWSPFPSPMLHHARIGLHDIGARLIGRGALNLRAGVLLPLDFAEPTHRALGPGPVASVTTPTGVDPWTLDGSVPGVQGYGRPGGGALHWELMASDGSGEGATPDGFGRIEATLFRLTSHAIRIGALGFAGNHEIETDLGGVVLAQRNEVRAAGLDVAAEAGRLHIDGLVWAARHSDPTLEGGPVSTRAVRAEVDWAPPGRLLLSLPGEWLTSAEDPSLDGMGLAPQAHWALAPDAILAAGWKGDPADLDGTWFVQLEGAL